MYYGVLKKTFKQFFVKLFWTKKQGLVGVLHPKWSDWSFHVAFKQFHRWSHSLVDTPSAGAACAQHASLRQFIEDQLLGPKTSRIEEEFGVFLFFPGDFFFIFGPY